MQVKKQQLEHCMERLTDWFKIEKVQQDFHPIYLIYTLITSWEIPGWMSYKLESR